MATTIQSKIPILFPLKEPELPVQAVSVDGTISVVEVTIEGAPVSFNREANGHFKRSGQCNIEPAYIAYIERQLSRQFN